ncbi:SGNH/GDSL hydrolase family protein [Aegicerativicinus sediminis]|uniref:SGNH/GDSL hydrolase family protein n=1 Tax=Aegicerativicinus sediminis TaxID=2893202 RepID=UPI001E31D4B5|nr:G-D-S-L family lipolytic protein [Aegicerativicinus sediminis]
MKNIFTFRYYLTFALISLFLVGCNDDDGPSGDSEQPLPELISGDADFSKYVSIGNSLTAGYTDGALFIAGQQFSTPNLLAQKFSLAGGGAFSQPLMNDNIGGLLIGGQENSSFGPRYVFDFETGLPSQLEGTPTTEATNVLSGPFNNMGVPGAKSFHLLFDGYGNPANLSLELANPYFVRFASSPTATILGDAMAQSPTFFTLWAGNQDILGYAYSGGESNPDSEEYDPLTDLATFSFSYSTLVNTLTSGGAKGVVANIPDINSLAHFTTVPHDPLDPSDPNFGPMIPTLNTLFGALNQVFTVLNRTDRYMQFSTTNNSAVVIKDETLEDLSAQITAVLNANPDFPAFLAQFGVPAVAAPVVADLLGIMYGQARKAKSNDLLTLRSGSVIGTVNVDFFTFLQSKGLSPEIAGQFSVEGITFPLDDMWVLIPSEQEEIKNRTEEFNSVIANIANQAGLGFFDANETLNQISDEELQSGNFVFTDDLVTGGLFSLDGIHPTTRGYALIANEFLKVIDATYGSNFEESGNLYNAGEFPTNYPANL